MYKEMFNLENKIALVVGGASGIGKAIVEGLKEFGAYVMVGDIKPEDAMDVADKTYYVDISNYESVKRIFSEISSLDILVSTPGINIRKKIEDYTIDEYKKIMSVDLDGHFYLAKEAIPLMKKRGGSMVFVSSIRAFVVEPGQGPYSMAKAGIVQLVKALACELGKYNIRVNALVPGVVNTPLTRQIKQNKRWYEAYAAKTALGRWAEPHEMVGAVLLLVSDAGSYITGTTIVVDGGWMAIDGRFDPFEEL